MRRMAFISVLLVFAGCMFCRAQETRSVAEIAASSKSAPARAHYKFTDDNLPRSAPEAAVADAPEKQEKPAAVAVQAPAPAADASSREEAARRQKSLEGTASTLQQQIANEENPERKAILQEMLDNVAHHIAEAKATPERDANAGADSKQPAQPVKPAAEPPNLRP